MECCLSVTWEVKEVPMPGYFIGFFFAIVTFPGCVLKFCIRKHWTMAVHSGIDIELKLEGLSDD